ncbi:hypothetical protein [Vibrio navarrensis]|uniref:hypothetical protein n=1 Tax=Vibrio navarrensis TaxID=29495 RepID=UPI00126A36C8|nr:hypothetical protein [Vibrio navarrensis]
MTASAMFGCSSTSEIPTTYSDSTISIKYPVYAQLERIDGQYEFTRFSSTPLNSGAWVNLATMAPTWSTDKENCFTGIVEYSNKSLTCKTGNEELFRSKGTDFTPGKTMGYVLFSVFSLGIAATMPPGSVEFDEDEYLDAISQAKRKLEQQMAQNGTTYQSVLLEADKSMSSFVKQYDSIAENYTYSLKNDIKVSDKTGLFEKTAYPLDSLVFLAKNSLPEPTIQMTVHEFGPNYLNSLKLTQDQKLSALKQATATVSVSCQENALSNVDYNIKCPKFVPTKDHAVPVELVINSISFKNILPYEIREKDNNIEVTFKNNTFDIINKSDSYIKVDSISFYYNGKIANIHKMDRDYPPQSQAVLTFLNSLPIERSALNFSNVSRDNAMKTKVNYGIAVKYRLLDSNKEITLYRNRQYPLLKLL